MLTMEHAAQVHRLATLRHRPSRPERRDQDGIRIVRGLGQPLPPSV